MVVGLLSAHVSSFDRPEADGTVSSHHQMIVTGLRDDPAGTRAAITAFMQPQADAYAADPAAFKEKWMADSTAAWGRPEPLRFPGMCSRLAPRGGVVPLEVLHARHPVREADHLH